MVNVGRRLTNQIGIIGAGPIGITLAKLLVEKGFKPVIIEAGGWQNESLLTLKNYTLKSNNKFPEGVRLVGGQSSKWLGRVSLFPKDAYVNRSKIVGHDWLIPFEDIQKAYEKISKIFDIPTSGLSKIHSCSNCVNVIERIQFWFMSNPNCFRDVLKDMISLNQVELVENTLVYKLKNLGNFLIADTITIENGVEQKTAMQFENIYICAGALESTRLILSSFPELALKTSGGKYLMDHFDGYIGTLKIRPKAHKCLRQLVLESNRKLTGNNFGVGISAFDKDIKWHLEICPKIRVYFFDPKIRRLPYLTNPIYQSLFFIERVLTYLPNIVSKKLSKVRNIQEFSLWLRAEEFPTSKSLLLLQKLAAGQIFANLTYRHRVSLRTRISLKKSLIKFSKIVRAKNLGYIKYFWWFRIPTFINLGGNNHPMGTLSIGETDYFPVDASLKLKIEPRIRVVSSAVFPSGSHQNPTAQVMALAQIAIQSLEL